MAQIFGSDDQFIQQIRIISQSANYMPTIGDVGHQLLFVVTLIVDQVGESSHYVTDMCIPMPSNPPQRVWIEHPVWTKLQQQQQQQRFDALAQPQAASGYMYSSEVDTKFVVASYNIASEGYFTSLLSDNDNSMARSIDSSFNSTTNAANNMAVLRRTFPDCPSYALSSVYRKKIQLREIVMYNADLICLQAIDSREYDSMYLELSRIGYSSTLVLNENLDTRATQQQHHQKSMAITV